MATAAEHASFIIRASTAFASIMSRQTRNAVFPIGVAVASQLVCTARSDREKKDAEGEQTDKKIPATQEEGECEEDGRKAISRPVLSVIGEQLTFGGVLGFATGYAVRTLAKPVLFLLGTEVLVLQYMAHKQWLSVHWGRIRDDLTPKFPDSNVNGLIDLLVYRMPFGASFTAGLLVALRTDGL